MEKENHKRLIRNTVNNLVYYTQACKDGGIILSQHDIEDMFEYIRAGNEEYDSFIRQILRIIAGRIEQDDEDELHHKRARYQMRRSGRLRKSR